MPSRGPRTDRPREAWIKMGVFPDSGLVFWADVWENEQRRKRADGPPKPETDPNEGW